MKHFLPTLLLLLIFSTLSLAQPGKNSPKQIKPETDSLIMRGKYITDTTQVSITSKVTENEVSYWGVFEVYRVQRILQGPTISGGSGIIVDEKYYDKKWNRVNRKIKAIDPGWIY